MDTTNTSLLELSRNPLMQAMRRVIQVAAKSRLAPECLSRMSPDLAAIGRIMDLTPGQSLLFTLFVEMSYAQEINLRDLCEYVECQYIDLVAMAEELEVLLERQLIRKREGATPSYRVPSQVLNAVKQGQGFTPAPLKGLSIDEFFKQADAQFFSRRSRELSSKELIRILQVLIEGNRHLSFCRVLRGYGLQDSLLEAALICLAAPLVNWGLRQVSVSEFFNTFSGAEGFSRFQHGIRTGRSLLHKRGIIEYSTSQGLADRTYLRLTHAACKSLFTELEVSLEEENPVTLKELLTHQDIRPKALFYNAAESRQVDTLADLLSPVRFAEICGRLQEKGLRSGFAALFYGAPGTGKTETVYQLARQSGRDILKVNIAETKSMWLGESEKCIQRIFDNYREMMKRCDSTPILLFNEADAVFSKRQQVDSRQPVQTLNAMQNILLQEMENLDGILIATTNLTHNLDKAFERRFLYKIEFCKPESSVRKAIWQAMMPELSDEVAEHLAERCDLSGGQIENVARRYTVEHILHGTPLTLEGILELCRAERIDERPLTASQHPIGFRGAGVKQ